MTRSEEHENRAAFAIAGARAKTEAADVLNFCCRLTEMHLQTHFEYLIAQMLC